MAYIKRPQRRIAVVTGANRGLGLETCRQLAKQGIEVILTSRDRAKGIAAAKILQNNALNVVFCPLDVTQPSSIESLKRFIIQRFGRVDILVNNAGIAIDTSSEDSLLDVKLKTIEDAMTTNVYSSLSICQALIPVMKSNNYGRIVNVSSGAGQLSSINQMNRVYPSYRLSKATLNAYTRILASEMRGTNILINAVCPGRVKTDLGGKNAPRSVEEGANGIVWAATLPDNSPTGNFFRDRISLSW